VQLHVDSVCDYFSAAFTCLFCLLFIGYVIKLYFLFLVIVKCETLCDLLCFLLSGQSTKATERPSVRACVRPTFEALYLHNGDG